MFPMGSVLKHLAPLFSYLVTDLDEPRKWNKEFTCPQNFQSFRDEQRFTKQYSWVKTKSVYFKCQSNCTLLNFCCLQVLDIFILIFTDNIFSVTCQIYIRLPIQRCRKLLRKKRKIFSHLLTIQTIKKSVEIIIFLIRSSDKTTLILLRALGPM